MIEAIGQLDRAYTKLEQTPLSLSDNQQLQQYYNKEFLLRLAKTEQGTPVLSAFVPKNLAGQYLQHRYLASNSNPVGKKHLLDDSKDGSDYSRLHARYHPMFREITEKFGYYNLFLINPAGEIVYTVYKETDFTTDLTNGPYRTYLIS